MVRVPAPAIVLVAAAITSTYISAVRDAVKLHDIEHVVTVALIVILFDGGLQLGRRKFRDAAVPIDKSDDHHNKEAYAFQSTTDLEHWNKGITTWLAR